MYQRGTVSTFSAWVGPAPLEDDEALHKSLVHHTAHGLMNLQRPAAWLAELRAGWADAGLAHWYEDALFGTREVFCYPGVEPAKALASGRWRDGVRKLVKAGETPPLDELFQLDTRELDLEQHAVSFSLIDYLMARDAEKLDELLVLLRSRSPTRDALKAVYGEDLETFEDGWKAWVRENQDR